MFRSASIKQWWLLAILLGSSALLGCDDHRKVATPDQVARFQYCSGFTSAAAHAAHRRLVDEALADDLRAQQEKASDQLALQPLEMDPGVTVLKSGTDGEVHGSTTTEVGRGMEEGAEMIDAKQRDKLLETIQECSALFKALTS